MFKISFVSLPRRYALHVLSVLAAALLVTLASPSAMAALFDSTFSVYAYNSPASGLYTSNATLPGTTVIDDGELSVTTSIVPVPNSSSEWLVFNYSTVGGVPLNNGGNWEVLEYLQRMWG